MSVAENMRAIANDVPEVDDPTFDPENSPMYPKGDWFDLARQEHARGAIDSSDQTTSAFLSKYCNIYSI